MSKKTEVKCGMCGMCCKAIHISYTKKAIKEICKPHIRNFDAEFIIKNWRRISKARAIEISPDIIRIFKNGGYYYECIMHKNNICSIHEDRPHICSGFPFYGHSKEINGVKKIAPSYTLYSNNCTFEKVRATNKEWKSE